MLKEIYFCVDDLTVLSISDSLSSCVTSGSYLDTEELINNYDRPIVTTSIAHLSFDLIDKGYFVYLCYKDRKLMVNRQSLINGRPIGDYFGGENSLLEIFLCGIFNELLGIEK